MNAVEQYYCFRMSSKKLVDNGSSEHGFFVNTCVRVCVCVSSIGSMSHLTLNARLWFIYVWLFDRFRSEYAVVQITSSFSIALMLLEVNVMDSYVT